MISIFPILDNPAITCTCGNDLHVDNNEPLWQGAHIAANAKCSICNKEYIADLPVGQGKISPFLFNTQTGEVEGNERCHWFAKLMYAFSKPDNSLVKITIDKKEDASEVILLNTVDFCYGHSFLFLLNLDNIFKNIKEEKVILIVQPMFLWLVPKNHSIAEVWTVHLPFSKGYNYYPKVSEFINQQIARFKKVSLSSAHLLPVIHSIEPFTGIKPFAFDSVEEKPFITFIWRQDGGRLWLKNRYFNYACQKSGFIFISRYIQKQKVQHLLNRLSSKLGNQYRFAIAGLGKSGKFSSFITDARVEEFTDESEKGLCKLYASSKLVIGIHGSSMLLPSAHAGMSVSIMPSKRWGNFLEDLLITEKDNRITAFQKRVVPMRMPITELIDICFDMLTGRDVFLKKFIYNSNEI